MRGRHSFLPLAAGVALAAVLPGPPAAAGHDEAEAAVAKYLESLEVSAGIEHRLVVLHPILARAAPEAGDPALRLAGTSSPDLLAVGRIAPSAKNRVEVVSFTEEPALVLQGDVLRTPTSDQVATADALLHKGRAADVHIARISREVEEEKSSGESAFMGELLPSPLRYLLMTDAPGAALRAAADTWAEDVKLATPRRSPEELGTAETVATRFGEYRKALTELPRAPAKAGTEIVGVVALVDGVLASIETFADGRQFRLAWPKLLAGIATEAVVTESRQNLLAEDLASSADPDRFLAGVKERLLALFAARLSKKDVDGGVQRFEISVDAASANALVLDKTRFVHFVLVTDPARREEKVDKEDPDLAAARRKPRPTEEEKRLLERRGEGGQPQPAAPKPADPPPPPPAPK